MKKLISAALAFALSVSTLVPVFAADTFKDVNSKSYSWAYNYVEDMAERGLIKGYEDGTFRPGNSVSRMDAFALFARLMGSNSEVNADILAAAKEKYEAVLAKYDLSYAEGDIAYMMSRGVLAETELDTYFDGKKKSEAMPRYEAAILITKAMLGEQDAKNEVLIDMDYTDVSSIPKAAKQYVYYVTQKEIMSGMGDGAFSANTDVLRGQIAVMLSRTADAMNYTFDSVTLGDLDEASKNIGIKDNENRDFTIGYGDDARFFKDAEPVAAAQMRSGQKAILTYVSDGTGSKLAFADVFTGEIDSKVKVIYKGNSSGSISVTDPADNSTKSYPLGSTVTVKADGKEIKVNELKSGDYIELGLAGSEVLSIETLERSVKIEAVIEKVGSLGTITVSSENPDYNGATLSMADGAVITKNNDVAAFADLGRGDKASILIEYGKIARINAMSDSKTVTGTLKGYYVSIDGSNLTVTRDGEDYTFDIPSNLVVMINGEKATLRELGLGSNITVSVEGEVVKKVTASGVTGTSSNEEIKGTVVGAYEKTIVIASSENGNDVQITISTTATTKIVAIPSLADYSIKKIKAGDTVTAFGGYANGGIFVATTIMISPAE